MIGNAPMRGRARVALGALGLVLAIVLSVPGTALASARDHDIPGRLMGTQGASGVLDQTTNPVDVYAIQLFAGQKVTFTIAPSDGDWDPVWYDTMMASLYAPDSSNLSDGAVVHDGTDTFFEVDPSFSYTPAVSGVYYLEMFTGGLRPASGLAYRITVGGSAGLPSTSTQWTAGIAPGFSASPVIGHATWLQGVLTPSFNSNCPLLASTIQIQESTDTVRWTSAGTIARDGIFGVSVAPTSQRWYRFVYAGDGGYAGSTSPVMHVAPLTPTSTRARASATTVKSRRRFRISGAVSPGGGGSCDVYVKKPGRRSWSRLATLGVGGSGGFSINTSFRPKGTYYFYVQFRGTSQLTASKSGTFKVKVR